jgi:hypothetical protein
MTEVELTTLAGDFAYSSCPKFYVILDQWKKKTENFHLEEAN